MNKHLKMRLARFAFVGAAGLGVMSCADEPSEKKRMAVSGSALLVARTVDVAGDSYARAGAPNSNQGSEPIVRLHSSGKNRGLLFFDTAAIQNAASGGTLSSATLELTIDSAASNWGASGRPIAVHRLLQASAEYSATHNCAHDSSIYNSVADCSAAAGTAWSMDASDPLARPWQQAATATTTITSEQTGTVSLDVTADVAAILSGTWPGHGFLLKKVDESQSGLVEFASRERGPAPRLALTVEVAGGGSGGAGPSDGGLDAGTQSRRFIASADTTVRAGEPHHNFGADPILRLQASGRSRALVGFDTQAITVALAGYGLGSARIELAISQTYDNWGVDRSIGVHRLRHAWTEPGATFNCSEDLDPSNSTDSDCISSWVMWAPMLPQEQIAWVDPPTSTTLISSGQTGVVSLDVTRDLACALAGHVPFHGFIVKKEAESQSGKIEFASRETVMPPALVIEYGSGAGVSVTAAQCAGGGTPPDGGVPDGGTCTPSGADDDCDGTDDDCDARIDEAYLVAEAQCGQGACTTTGERSCVNGVEQDSCVAATPGSGDATCDGVDDNCNGVDDEGFLGTPTSCGVGTCAASGATACVNGAIVDDCTPGTPRDDADCNQVDDDCDGLADDNYPFTCSAECLPIELVATRAYEPAGVTDGTLVLVHPISVTVPLLVPVVAGSAGSAGLTLTYQPAGGTALVECLYAGSTEGVAGSHYALQGCSDGTQPGDAVTVESLVLHVDGGDPLAGATTVRMRLETCGGRFGLPGELPIPDDLEYALNTELGIPTGAHQLIVTLDPGATWEDTRAALARVGGRVIGAMPEVGLVVVGFDASIDFAGLATALEALKAEPAVSAASYDLVLEEQSVPKPSRTGNQATAPLAYDWLQTPVSASAPGGNWGLRYVRAPIAWNLIEPVLARDVNPVDVAVIDVGFRKHRDLTVPTGSNRVYAPLGGAAIFRMREDDFEDSQYAPADPRTFAHGTRAAGIIGAEWGDGELTDGVTPFVRIGGYLTQGFDNPGVDPNPNRIYRNPTGYIQELGEIVEASLGDVDLGAPASRIINLSLGIRWQAQCWVEESNPTTIKLCHPRSDAFPLDDLVLDWDEVCDPVDLRQAIDDAGKTFAGVVNGLRRDVLIVVSAGNQALDEPVGIDFVELELRGRATCNLTGFPARVANPMTNAALRNLTGSDVLIAEALDVANGAVTRAEYSNVVGASDRGNASVLAPGGRTPALGGATGIATLDGGCGVDETNPNCDPGVSDQSVVVAFDGTSAAAPFVSGAAAYLLAACPGLTNAELRHYLVDRARADSSFPGTTTRARLDLAASLRALAEDGRCSIARMFADMGDDTPDGFTKTQLNVGDQAQGKRPPPVASFEEEPDGKVDMRDFRRFRDLYHVE